MSSHDLVPLSPYQRDIWVAHTRSPRFTLWACERVEAPDRIDHARLRECVARVLARHEGVRMRFAERDGTPYQRLGELPVVPVLDLGGEPDPEAAALAWARAREDQPFDPARGCLTARVLRAGDRVAYVYLGAHRLVADGWSLHLLLAAVRAEYAGAAAEPPRPYADFVDSQRGYADSPRYERDRAHFAAALEGAEPGLFPRRAPSGQRATRRHVFTLDRSFVADLAATGHSAFTLFSTAVAVYLSRVHRTGDIVLGVPLLNRGSALDRRTVGSATNTLPLRLRVRPEASLRQLADEVAAATRELKRHEKYPLGDLLRGLPAGRRALFDTTISYVHWPEPRTAPGLTSVTTGTGRAQDQDALAFWLLDLDPDRDVEVHLEYGADVFDEHLPVESMVRHVTRLLRAFRTVPDAPVREVPMLDPEEFADLVHDRNATDAAYPDGTTLGELLGARAFRQPDRVAVTGAGGVTYRELVGGADRVASALRRLGIGRDDRVAVLAERGLPMLQAIYGVLRAGAAYVPVDPSYPPERIRFLVEDCGAWAVLTDGYDLPGALPIAELLELPPARVEVDGAPADLAYVIYTSGSTGRPKGVQVEHRSVLNRLAWMQKRYPLGPADVLLQKTPSCFDVSVWELFWWALEGARLALLPPGAERDPERVLAAVAAHGVTVLHFVPSMLGPFLDLLEQRPALRPASLRLVFASGEALPPARVAQFSRVFGTSARLVNLYGPTEGTVDVTAYDCPPVTEPPPRVPIGRPIDNMRMYVLDPDGAPQPPGVPGELCIAGVGVARGYLDRPELTAERFADDPFVPGGRMYRTGDLARWLACGNLEYLGRLDGQVKVRGNRVELGEVQGRLAGVPGVREALVVDQVAGDGGTYLAGYYVADEELEVSRLRAELARSLPDYMVPARFRRIPAVPLTPNGKADRAALPASGEAAPGSVVPGSVGAGARNPVEEILAEAWAAALELPSVGVHDNWFALGGDAVRALRVAARAARQGVGVDPADVPRHPTVAALALVAGEVSSPPDLAPYELLAPDDAAALAAAGHCVDAYPASSAQLAGMTGGQVYRFVLRTGWDERAFRRAYQRLVARHPVLRSAFALGGFAEPLQVVHGGHGPGGLRITDLRGLPAPDAEEAVRQHVAQRRRYRYRADTPPLYLFRAHLRPSTVDLVVSCHRALLDGSGVAALVGELVRDYRHGAVGTPAVEDGPQPAPGWAVLGERRALAAASSRAYWRELLAGCTDLPLQALAPATPPSRTEPLVHREPLVHLETLPAELTRAVRAFPAATGLPVASALLAAHVLTLRALTGAADVTTGLVTDGRPDRDGADRMAGRLETTVPVRLGPAAGSWLEAVRELFEQELRGLPHRRYPLPALRAERGGQVPRTAFQYAHPRALAESLACAGVPLERAQLWEQPTLPLLVRVLAHPTDGTLLLRVDADPGLVGPEPVARLARTYQRILSRIVTAPHEPADLSCPAAPAADGEADGLEAELTRLWARTLERDRIAPGEDYFGTANGPLTALILVLAIEERYGVEIPLPAFLDTPTVAGMAARLRAGEFAPVAA
jgi:amino acid adenylation domain-containing protein